MNATAGPSPALAPIAAQTQARYKFLDAYRQSLFRRRLDTNNVTSVNATLRLLAENAATARLQQVHPDASARLRDACSSSALAVNTFGPFRRHPHRLVIGGISGFTETEFEHQCSNGLPGANHYFNFWGATRDCVVAVETTFLDVLNPQTAKFSERYDRPFLGTDSTAAIAEARWTAVFRALRDDPNTYRHLDAAQLMKDYLGLKHSYPDRRRVLIYVYWEPSNAAALSEYMDHRKEVADFAMRVRGLETRFMALSCPDLWNEWQDVPTWPGMPEHLARLRARYSFAI